MSKRSYTLLEYLVALEKKINELAINGTGGSGTGGSVDLTGITTQINNLRNQLEQLETKHNSFESSTNVKYNTTNSKIATVENNFNSFKNTTNSNIQSVNSNIQSANNNISTLEENKMNNIQKIEYTYVGGDTQSYNLFTNGQENVNIKVYDDFNNYLLKDNENYKRTGDTLTFNYISPIKIRIEYY